jgi:two-component system sensor histidine kinase RegB
VTPRPPPKTLAAGSWRSAPRLRLRTLVVLRWIALIGQAVALSVVYFGFGFEFPLVSAMAVVLAAGVVNVALSIVKPSSAWLGDWQAAAMLALDLLQLAIVLGLTGGLSNPFAVLILVPVAVGAWALAGRVVLPLAGLAAVLVSGLAFWHLPLPGAEVGLLVSAHYVFGTWTALVIAIGFIAVAIAATAREERQMSRALEATRMALSREQRLSALGGLAAVAAHELGSPLSTIAIIARELEKGMPADAPWHEDVKLLLEESDRCRSILGRLAADPKVDVGEPYASLPLTTLVEAAATPFKREGVELSIKTSLSKTVAEDIPLVGRDPAVLHGLGTLIENAIEFAETEVLLELRWAGEEIGLKISDDGPGFDLSALSSIGEPYYSTGRKGRSGGLQEDHMGLGVFIARTLLGHSGAELTFSNRTKGNAQRGGASVNVVWPSGLADARGTASGGAV